MREAEACIHHERAAGSVGGQRGRACRVRTQAAQRRGAEVDGGKAQVFQGQPHRGLAQRRQVEVRFCEDQAARRQLQRAQQALQRAGSGGGGGRGRAHGRA